MSTRIQRLPTVVPNPGPEVYESELETRETTVDGITFAWGPGQIRNFLDDGYAVAVGAFDGDVDEIVETGLFATNGQSRA